MPTPVIIDTDPGVDDILALLYALASPELEVLAIIVSYGNTDIEHAYANIIKLYSTLHAHFSLYPSDKDRFPNFIPKSPDHKPFLARGADRPLEGDIHNAQYFHGRDGLGNISALYPTLFSSSSEPSPNSIALLSEDLLSQYLTPTSQPAPDLVLDILRSHPPRSITYIALGPLTNLYLAASKEGGTDLIRERIGRIVIMGGALDVPGNTNPVAEFNFFADPYAVKELLVSSSSSSSENENEKGNNNETGETLPLLPLDRVLLLPLDITTLHELHFPTYTKHIDPSFVRITDSGDGVKQIDPNIEVRGNPIKCFTSAFLRCTREVMIEFGKDAMELHDIVAVWCAVHNPPLPNPTPSTPKEGNTINVNDSLRDGWKARRRVFEVERKGEITRGMLVVDRRSEGMVSATTEYKGNTSESDKELKKKNKQAEEASIPAPVQVENAEEAQWLDRHHHHAEQREQEEGGGRDGEHDTEGVPCVVKTPGCPALVSSMYTRIWGCRLESEVAE